MCFLEPAEIGPGVIKTESVVGKPSGQAGAKGESHLRIGQEQILVPVRKLSASLYVHSPPRLMLSVLSLG